MSIMKNNFSCPSAHSAQTDSFRGMDTRRGFADHLYHSLKRVATVFRDNEGLARGREISEVFGAIERSKIFIPIFSSNYADSKWCLQEIERIVKVAIEGERRRLILPVFYRTEPTHVRHQTGPFEAAFRKHEEDDKLEEETVKKSREALSIAADLAGYESEKTADGYEGRLVEMIVQRVVEELKHRPQDADEQLVGIKSRANDIIKILDINSKGARMVGIHGMGGLGKTTVAKAVYNKICRAFEFHCFISDIRKKCLETDGLVKLQSQLMLHIFKVPITISNTSEGTCMLQRILQNKRVLIVLDDVDRVEQVEALAGKQEWFHPGSRVIVTTRDEALHNALDGWEQSHKNYGPKTLNEDESLELFSRFAFRKNSPIDGYRALSLNIVRVLDGLPLAIKTVASTLYQKRDTKYWDEIMKRWSGLRDDEIYRTLRVSYDDLSSSDERSIFLDVACFFGGIDEETAICIWDACGFSSRLSIDALIDKSLIEIIDGKLELHNMLREMGKRIVEEELGTGPETQSRLWVKEDIINVLEQQKGTSKIEGINLTMQKDGNNTTPRGANDNAHSDSDNDDDSDEEIRPVEAGGFASMDKLRLLMINHVNLMGRYKSMPKRIKWLQWQGCPLKFLPPDFDLKKVAALDLSYSNIVQLRKKPEWWWSSGNKDFGLHPNFTKQRKENGTVFDNLKFLDLTACNKLTVTPDLSAFPKLKKLVLDRCDNLVKVHESIANLEMLVVLSMRSCGKLKELPDCVSCLTSLKQLNLANCFGLKELPDWISLLTSLEQLNLANCFGLERVPDCIYQLKELDLSNCTSLKELASVEEPERHHFVFHLSELSSDTDECWEDFDSWVWMVDDEHHLKKLDLSGSKLDLSGSRMQELPFSICLKKNLRILNFDDCQLLAEVPGWIADLCLLEELSLSNCPLIRELPHTIGSLTKLRHLNLSHCNGVQVLPDCIGDLESLTELLLQETSLVELPESVGRLTKLKILHLGSCRRLKRLPFSIGNLENLTELLLDGTNIGELPSSIASLRKLELLTVRGCRRLEHMPDELSEDLLLLH